VAVPVAVKIIRKGKRLVWGEGWRFIFKMTLPMLPHFIAASVIAQSDKIIIARMLGDEVLGKYGAAYSIGFIPSQLTGATLAALSPWIIRKMKEGRGEEVKESVISATRVIGYATLIFLAVLPELFFAAAAPGYREALPVSYAIAISVIFSFPASAISICILHYEKPMLITKNSLITAVPAVLFTYLFIGKFGYIGGALSSLCAYVTLFLLNQATIIRVAGKGAKTNLALPTAAFFLFATLIFLLRFSLVSRLIIAVAIALLALPEAKKCKKLLF
jgi:O-antigen/teichoic acid export membrane protein